MMAALLRCNIFTFTRYTKQTQRPPSQMRILSALKPGKSKHMVSNYHRLNPPARRLNVPLVSLLLHKLENMVFYAFFIIS